MKSGPFFSVIIPVFNRAHLIGRAISSVMEQSFDDFELIVVNDGSTDGTDEVVRSFNDSRIRYFETANRERGAARNFGADNARGMYLNFFDSDDCMYSIHLHTAHRFATANSLPHWFHTLYDLRDNNASIIATQTGYEANAAPAQLIVSNYLGCNSVFIRREFFQENKFCEDRALASSEDWELWLRLISRKPLHACRETTFFMLEHGGRSLNTISADQVVDRDTILLKRLAADVPFVVKFGGRLPLFSADRYTFFALKLILDNRPGRGLHYLWKAFQSSTLVVTRRRFWACFKLLLLGKFK